MEGAAFEEDESLEGGVLVGLASAHAVADGFGVAVFAGGADPARRLDVGGVGLVLDFIERVGDEGVGLGEFSGLIEGEPACGDADAVDDGVGCCTKRGVGLGLVEQFPGGDHLA